MRGLILLALLGLAAGAKLVVEGEIPVSDNGKSFQYFRDWQAKHGKTYGSIQELSHRYTIFMDNMKKAEMLNSLRDTEDAATFGPTKFADLTQEEFEKAMLGSFKPGRNGKVRGVNRTAAPASFDWTDKGYVVTPIKDQGRDGTCWAFAGVANVESQYGIKNGKQCPDLSPESLNDCDGYSNIMQGAVACGGLGATMPAFYIWVIEQGGIMTEADYPYCVGIDKCRPCAPEGYNEELCGGPWPLDPCNQEESCDAKYDPSKFVPGTKVKDYYYIKQDEAILVEALYELGPLVAGIDATDMQLYTGGVLAPKLCSPTRLNHAVVLVGYDTTSSGEAVWRVKNSWGTGWGEEGFFRIQRGTGACGINLEVSTVELA